MNNTLITMSPGDMAYITLKSGYVVELSYQSSLRPWVYKSKSPTLNGVVKPIKLYGEISQSSEPGCFAVKVVESDEIRVGSYVDVKYTHLGDIRIAK